MATSPVITGAPTRASSNVVRLPTAAARKVQQPTPRRCSIAVAAGAATRMRAEHLPTRQHQIATDAETLATIHRTPELLLVMSLLRAADETTKARVVGACIAAKMMTPDSKAAEQALAVSRVISRGSRNARRFGVEG